jgi:hypothetical protein
MHWNISRKLGGFITQFILQGGEVCAVDCDRLCRATNSDSFQMFVKPDAPVTQSISVPAYIFAVFVNR